MGNESPVGLQRTKGRGDKLVSPNGLLVVCVDRSTKWGNPFVVGKHGTANECTNYFCVMLNGKFVVATKNTKEQLIYMRHYRANLHKLQDKNLACWCKVGVPCHRDALIRAAAQ